MEDKNCWDFWDCPDEVKNGCPAFKVNAGKDCYNLAKDFCPRLKNDFEYCWQCPWYKKIKPENEI